MRYTILTILLVLLSYPGTAQTAPPRRAMILVFDHMRAEYIDRFQLPNFQRARQLGLNFDNGYVGHLESNTVISHPVISSGLLPGHFAWGSLISKDERGLVGPRGGFFMPARLRPHEWMAMQRKVVGELSLAARIKKLNPGPSFAVAQKAYSAYNFGGPYADSIICLGEVLESGPYQGYHRVAGARVPDYLTKPIGNRFYLEGLNTWGTTGLQGTGYVEGVDPERPGGDRWVGDVVEQIMLQEPDWSLILASFGAIDKISHVLAEHESPTEADWALEHGITLENSLRQADRELGRILSRLERSGLLEETALLITADHGGQRNLHFHGRKDAPNHRDDSYFGKGKDFDFTSNPIPEFREFIEQGDVQALSLGTSVLGWTGPLSEQEREQLSEMASRLPGVAEVYRLLPDGAYRREFRSPLLKGPELEWARTRHPGLVDSLRGPGAPDLIALLFDNHGYGMIGAHGGAQELVQRIPMIVLSPNLVRKGSRSRAWVRLVDLNPILGELMGIPPDHRLDGTSDPVKPFLKADW
ncbi:MAG: alkaline phosphatase family protein [Vulcanimicrobiota bacterium]